MLINICILSYNRPLQLKRILENFVGFSSTDISITIKDDRSPQFDQISALHQEFESKLEVPIYLVRNEDNFGYDKNLYTSLELPGAEYTFLLSDDDYIDTSLLHDVIDFVKASNADFYFSKYIENGNAMRITPVTFSVPDFTYNSILFSGLVFRNSLINLTETEKTFLAKCIYTQVFITLDLYFRGRAFEYIETDFLILGGDGENYFGVSDSSANMGFLRDRENMFSNFDYQQLLLKTIDYATAKHKREVDFNAFLKAYHLRLLGYLFKIRAVSYGDLRLFLRVKVNGSQYVSKYFHLVGLLVGLVPSRVAQYIYTKATRKLRKSG